MYKITFKFVFLLFLFTFIYPYKTVAQTNENVTGNIPNNAEDIRPILTGTKIPDVTLTDVFGNPVNLLTTVSKKPVILIFYRGGWCPYCNTQMSHIQKIDSSLKELGYDILAVSPDTPNELGKSIDKNNLNYTLLSDSSMDACSKFGIAFKVNDEIVEKYKSYNIDLEGSSGMKHHLLPVPSVFIIGTDGIVKFQYVNPNYKVRIDSDLLLAAAIASLK
jgi:peroxiredoxin